MNVPVSSPPVPHQNACFQLLSDYTESNNKRNNNPRLQTTQPLAIMTDQEAQGSNDHTTTKLRVGTWNVHQFSDSNAEGTFDDMVALLRVADLDVIGLQEATGALLVELVHQLNQTNTSANHAQYQLACKFGGTALITRFPVVDASKPGKGRYCCCRVLFPGSNTNDNNDWSIINLHLDHRQETTRSKEIQTILQSFAKHGRPLPDLWMGDFNALTAADYTAKEWKEIRNVRARNHWELPVSNLTCLLTKQIGLTDAYHAVATNNRSGPDSTCRFGTRIDYIYYRTDRLACNDDLGWRVVSVTHMDCRRLSDHNLVVTTWKRQQLEPQDTTSTQSS